MRTITALVACAALLTGCAATSPRPATRPSSPPSSAPADAAKTAPAAVLAAAVGRLDTQRVRYTLGDGTGAQAEGIYDPGTRVHLLARQYGNEHLQIFTTGDTLVVGGAKEQAGKYWRVDVGRLSPQHPFQILLDPFALAHFLGTAERVSARTERLYSGVYNLSAVPASPPAARRAASRLGATAAAVVFMATVDEQVRLTEVRATFPKADSGKDLTMVLRISQYGGSQSVSLPPANVTVPAPESAYHA
jgi:hypothetical protein